MLNDVDLSDLHSARSEWGVRIPIFYSITGFEYFELEESVQIVPDLLIDHAGLATDSAPSQGSGSRSSGTSGTSRSRRLELVVDVRNARTRVSYFCDVEGASKVTRAVLTNGYSIETGSLQQLRCSVDELVPELRAYQMASSSKRVPFRIITNEGYHEYHGELLVSPDRYNVEKQNSQSSDGAQGYVEL